MTATRDIRSYSFSDSDRLLVDTNVWFSVYGPVPYRRKRADAYSKALAAIKRARSLVYIDVCVMSEFVNHYARWEHRLTGDQFTSFKDFRNSGYFTPVAKRIATCAMGILRSCERCNSCFTSIDESAVFNTFAAGDKDFNDQIIVEICKEKDLILLTDDGDFSALEIDILTANNRLLCA